MGIIENNGNVFGGTLNRIIDRIRGGGGGGGGSLGLSTFNFGDLFQSGTTGVHVLTYSCV